MQEMPITGMRTIPPPALTQTIQTPTEIRTKTPLGTPQDAIMPEMQIPTQTGSGILTTLATITN